MAEATPGAMVRSMATIGALCGLAIVSVHGITAPRIERNRAEALERAVLEVLPGAEVSRTLAPELEGVHAAFDGEGGLVGFAVEAQGMGYQDVIRVIYGYDPRVRAVVGLEVLESRETPGLGDRIETDPAFLANFERLDVSLTPDGASLAHPIELVKAGEKTDPWQIDALSGATVSSRAIADMLAASTASRIPALQGRTVEAPAPDPPAAEPEEP